jgi:hypothetical protein
LGLSLTALSSTRAERDAYRADGDSYRSERDIYRAERDTAGAERDAARSERDIYRAEADAAHAEAVAARAEADAARAERDSARAEADAARAERDVAYAERDAACVEWHQSLSALRATEERLGWIQGQWDELRSSQSWRAFHQMHRLGTRMAPDGSHRRRAFKRIARLVELLGLEGAIELTRRQVRQAIDRKTARRGRGVAGDRLGVHGPTTANAARGGRLHSNRTDSHTRAR